MRLLAPTRVAQGVDHSSILHPGPIRIPRACGWCPHRPSSPDRHGEALSRPWPHAGSGSPHSAVIRSLGQPRVGEGVCIHFGCARISLGTQSGVTTDQQEQIPAVEGRGMDLEPSRSPDPGCLYPLAVTLQGKPRAAAGSQPWEAPAPLREFAQCGSLHVVSARDLIRKSFLLKPCSLAPDQGPTGQARGIPIPTSCVSDSQILSTGPLPQTTEGTLLSACC